jgi:hypothetical protein
LLFELLRHKYRSEQIAADKKVPPNGKATMAAYLTECEGIGYKVVVEHHKLVAASGKGIEDTYGKILRTAWANRDGYFQDMIKLHHIDDLIRRYLELQKHPIKGP